MAACVLRHWKESAALLVIRRLQPAKPHKDGVVGPPPPPLLDLQHHTTSRAPLNYQLFMAERSSKISSFPKAHVFPGGAAEEADFSAKWLEVFNMGSCKPGQQQTPESQLVNYFVARRSHNKNHTNTPNVHNPMYDRQRLPEFSEVPSEVAFRITAIREFFEEVGILFARKADENNSDESENHSKPTTDINNNNYQEMTGMRRCQAKICDLRMDLSEFWRQSVVEDSANFLNMCQQLRLIPDITALSEWSNWLTPTHSKGKRFDTMFYVTFLDEHQRPAIRLNQMELVDCKWLSPSEFLSGYWKKNINLFPPQIWELYHLNFASWEECHSLVASRPYIIPDRFLPVKTIFKDGPLFLLPGDHMYPDNPDLEKYREISVKLTKEEMRSMGNYVNHFDSAENKIYRTSPLPFTSTLDHSKPKSKL
ncbi:nucleoside diphosphate-linked moiety X motif 19-like [Argonauta hians]